MARKRKQKNHEIYGVVLIAVALIFAVAVYNIAEGGIAQSLKEFTFGLFGIASYILPVVLIALGVVVIADSKKKKSKGKGAAIAVGSFGILSVISVFTLEASYYQLDYLAFLGQTYTLCGKSSAGGGLFGSIFLYPLYSLLGAVFTYIILFVIIIICILIITRISIKEMSVDIGRASKSAALKVADNVSRVRETYQKKRAKLYIDEIEVPEEPDNNNYLFVDDDEPLPRVRHRMHTPPPESPRKQRHEKTVFSSDELGFSPVEEPMEMNIPLAQFVTDEQVSDEQNDDFRSNGLDALEEVPPPWQEPIKVIHEEYREDDISVKEQYVPKEQYGNVHHHTFKTVDNYARPTADLLVKPPFKARKNAMEATMRKATLLEETLLSFGVKAKVIDVSRGPVVTRYELQPAPGVKISRIVQLADDIALNLAAPRVRIEAPIPGKAAVGIEIPNSEVDSVYIYDMLTSQDYVNFARKAVLPFALGQDLAGKNIYADLNAMPHMLVAGSTGSGKSVCINTIIISMLMNSTPEEVRMIMVDPKVVELSVYNDIPHLMVPVVTDPKKAASALNWAVSEMTNRYKMFAARGAKDLKRYNALLAEDEEKLPYLVIIIDELADLMMVCQNEVEEAICRIAQLGRASGIHLIIATQRPSVDVITGIIKANIPSRIAFAVSSQIDSRTILDMAGAEKLLGKGDMLYYPIGVPKPIRVQGAFIQDKEVENITDFLKTYTEANYDEEIINNLSAPIAAGGEEDEEADVLLPRAIEVGLEFGSVSISMIQRRLRVGYARAARLLDEMEVRGLVSVFEGSKPRQMLITREEFERLNREAK